VSYRQTQLNEVDKIRARFAQWEYRQPGSSSRRYGLEAQEAVKRALVPPADKTQAELEMALPRGLARVRLPAKKKSSAAGKKGKKGKKGKGKGKKKGGGKKKKKK
jgi:hypothetical protein